MLSYVLDSMLMMSRSHMRCDFLCSWKFSWPIWDLSARRLVPMPQFARMPWGADVDVSEDLPGQDDTPADLRDFAPLPQRLRYAIRNNFAALPPRIARLSLSLRPGVWRT